MIWRPYRDHIEMGPPERGVGNRGQQQVMDGWVRGYKLGRRAPLAGCQQKGFLLPCDCSGTVQLHHSGWTLVSGPLLRSAFKVDV